MNLLNKYDITDTIILEDKLKNKIGQSDSGHEKIDVNILNKLDTKENLDKIEDSIIERIKKFYYKKDVFSIFKYIFMYY